MPKFITVVYTINDEAKFKEERDRLFDDFKSSEGKAWSITAISDDHEIRRLEWVEQALEAKDMDAVDAAISHIDIGNVNSLEDLSSL